MVLYDQACKVVADRVIARGLEEGINGESVRSTLCELFVQLEPFFTVDALVLACLLIERLDFKLWRRELQRLSYERFGERLPYLMLISLLVSDKFLDVWDVHPVSRMFEIIHRTRLSYRDFMCLELAFLFGLQWRINVRPSEFKIMLSLVDHASMLANHSASAPPQQMALRDRSNLPEEAPRRRKSGTGEALRSGGTSY